MRIRNRQSGKRYAVSSLLAELVLVVVVLIAGVIMGGFVFGTMSTFTSPAEVAAQVSGCSAGNGGEVCELTLANQGAGSVMTAGVCSISIGGTQMPGRVENGGLVPASGSLDGVKCFVSGATAPAGSTLTGVLRLMNYASVYFTATSS